MASGVPGSLPREVLQWHMWPKRDNVNRAEWLSFFSERDGIFLFLAILPRAGWVQVLQGFLHNSPLTSSRRKTSPLCQIWRLLPPPIRNLKNLISFIVLSTSGSGFGLQSIKESGLWITDKQTDLCMENVSLKIFAVAPKFRITAYTVIVQRQTVL